MKKLLKGCLFGFIGLVGIVILLGIIVAVFGESEDVQQVDNAQEAISVQGNAEINNGEETATEIQETEALNVGQAKLTLTPTKEKPTLTPIKIVDNAPSFSDICENSTTAGKTELEWDTFKKGAIGTYLVDRVSIVDDVDQGLFGGYSLILNPGQSFGGCGIKIYIDVTEEEGLNIKKDQEMVFTGKLSSIAEIFSNVTINLEDASYQVKPETAQNTDENESSDVPTGKIGEAIECGKLFTVTVLEPPELSQGMGYGERAVGTYFILKLEIVNNGSKTYGGFDDDYFRLYGTLNDKKVEFTADWDASWTAARRQYGYKFMGDDVPPGLPWRTQVAFDVNPQAKDLIFVLSPRDNYFDSNNICEVRVAVPTE